MAGIIFAAFYANATENRELSAKEAATCGLFYGADRDTIAFTIRHGRSGTMPSFAATLGDDRIAIVAAYVSSLHQ